MSLILLLLLVAGTPLAFDGSVPDAALVPRLIFVGALNILSLCWCTYLAWTKRVVAGKMVPAVLSLLLVLLGASAWSISESLNVPLALLELMRQLTYICTFLVSFSLLSNKKALSALPLIGIGITWVLLAIAGWQYVEINTPIPAGTPYPGDRFVDATFGNTNFLTASLLLLLPFCGAPVLQAKRWLKILSSVTVGAVLVVFVILQPLAVWISMILAIGAISLVLLPRFLPNNPVAVRAIRIGAPVVLAGIGLLFALQLVQTTETSRQTSFYETQAGDSWSHRKIMLTNTALLLREDWTGGIGLGNWPVEIHRFGLGGNISLNSGQMKFMRAHNDFLQLWSEVGLLGLLAYAALFGVAIKTGVDRFRESKLRIVQNQVLIALVVVFLFGALSLFYFVHERIYPSVLFLLALGMLAAAPWSLQRWAMHRHVLVSICIAAIAIQSVALGWSVLRYRQEVVLLQVMDARQDRDFELVGLWSEMIYPNMLQSDPTGTPIAWYRGLHEMEQGLYGKAIRTFEEALSAHPYHLQVLNDLGGSYFALNRFAEADSVYEQALTITPCYFDGNLNRAICLYKMGRKKEAREILYQPCLKQELKKPPFRTAIRALFHAEYQQMRQSFTRTSGSTPTAKEDHLLLSELISYIQQDISPNQFLASYKP